MSEISNKSRIEFRCRPVRSSSCSDYSNITAKVATVKNNRKIVLNVPKKILTLTLAEKSKLTLPLNNTNSKHTSHHNNFAQTYNKYNSKHKQEWNSTSR